MYFETVEGSFGIGCEQKQLYGQDYELMMDLVSQGYLEQ